MVNFVSNYSSDKKASFPSRTLKVDLSIAIKPAEFAAAISSSLIDKIVLLHYLHRYQNP